mmetsp:Transcript_50873/g.118845  ORF Transcript_50873/g.118845 Transcript_50873/m.118845 type:complete len:675 (+) Transcript_50873:55-2079(+)
MDLIDGAETPPPPQHDLNVVYRPDIEGLGLREAPSQAGQDAELLAMLSGARQEDKKDDNAAALLLSEPLVPDQQAAARPAVLSVNLLDTEPASVNLLEPASVNLLEPEPQQQAVSGGQAVPSLLGGLEEPSTAASVSAADQLLLGDLASSPAPRQGWKESTFTDELPAAPRGVIDLSAPSSSAPSAAAQGVASQAQPSAPPTAGKELSAFNKTTGFGSQDLFPEDQPKSDSQQVLGQFMEILPENVKEQVKTQLAAAGCAVREATPAPAEAAAPSTAEQGASTEEHERKALERAVEGRWVPTYMRQQLHEHGHTELPTRPNAHEYSANQPPPSLADAFQGMGEDLGEGCQNLIQYIMAVLSTCAFHCQMCTEHAASTAHEQAIFVQENGLQGLCTQASGAADGLSDVPGRLPDEEASGFGPVRSRWRRHMQVGNRIVTFKRMLEISKTMLTGDSAPAQFGRVVQARKMTQHTFYREATIESCTFVSEVNTDIIPNDVLQHVCSGAARCQEKWFVEVEENRAQVEISNELAQGMVLVILRMDIMADSPSSACEVDSRLYVRSQNRETPLPVGLMERLIEAHTVYSESYRELIVSLAAEDESQLPVVRWQQPDRAPSWAAEGPRRSTSGISQPPPLEVPSKAVGGLNLGMGLQDTGAVGVEKAMMMQMADGIGQGI